ncbi:hypothetical protein [Streptomyces sp. NPDC013455]|uniref:hypothetical protein n=1 Tax=Streptomyces sp. NPDC013455 TaxID=3155605 RepID=UPI0033EFC0C9
MTEPLPFYAEVRVVRAPDRPHVEGELGAVIGISDPPDQSTPPAYAVLLDGEEELYTFLHDEMEPTGHMRKREDYY